MKRQIFLMAIFAILACAPALAVRPNVIVSGYSIKEGSAQPGKDMTLVLNLVNTEPTACARTITTSIQAGSRSS
jgi:hypothetical protein